MVKKKPRLSRLAGNIPKGDAFLLSVNNVALRGGEVSLHTHEDFEELFVVEEGTGIHWINGKKEKLSPGALSFVRKEDCHAFYGKSLIFANLSFPYGLVRALCGRHFPGKASRAFLGGRFPASYKLPPLGQEWLLHRLGKLNDTARRSIDLELFFLELMTRLLEPGSFAKETPEKAPAWLTAALEKISDPKHFAHGPRGLVELTGRSAEHVSREVKRHLGKTPTRLVNEARLKWAARELEVTDRDILDVALASGFGSLGSFYRVFQNRYHASPRKYRILSRKLSGG